jgi:hypothetical protein
MSMGANAVMMNAVMTTAAVDEHHHSSVFIKIKIK